MKKDSDHFGYTKARCYKRRKEALMTRLVEEDINTLIINLKAYDGTLKQ